MMPAVFFAASCMLLLMLQRDLGTALIYYLTTLILFYAACGNVPMTVAGIGGGVFAAGLGYRLFSHVKVRVAMWRNPWSDPNGGGYQIIQALLAIGSGGLFGVGLGQGTPEKIPEFYNDFIFAVICEQLGQVFGVLLLLLHVLLILRGVALVCRARRSFDMLLACGVLASLDHTKSRIHEDMRDKYSELKRSGNNQRVKSQWRGPVIYMTSVFILFYIFIASILSIIILRWCLPKRVRNNPTYRKKRPIIALACGVFLFTLFITIAKSVVHHNFITMAVGITLNYSWLMLVILVSLLIRLKGNQIKAGVMAYTPFMLMAFVVIVFRIVFIPNNLVNLIFPPLLLAFTIWQLLVIKNRKTKLPTSDIVFSFISLMAMIVGCVLAWIGYTLLAVQIMVWWSFQLACIQSIICIYDLAKLYEEKHLIKRIKKTDNVLNQPSHGKKKKKEATEEKLKAKLLAEAKKGDHINNTWFFDLIMKVVVPVLAVLSVLLSISFAANMFDMNELLVKAFFYNFVDQQGLVQVSLYKIVLVSALFFVFYYLNYLIHSIYRRYKLKQYAKTSPSRRPNITLANNIITILVWGSFFIFALVLFKVPKNGISLISAGLATGLGFAMKDILENFIYGLSLMSGRVRVGDYIECDGIMGKIESIGYQSTQIVTLDGSIIAFLNTQLFNKNFKNMTKNHSYEYVKLPVGVAYGVDVEHVRNLLVEELNKLTSLTSPTGRPIIQKKTSFTVFFNDFGDNSVDLLVAFWVLVEERIRFVYTVKETIYKTLQSNNIEIPFPQRDVYIRSISQPTPPPTKKTKKNIT